LLTEHLKQSQHSSLIPDYELWNITEFFFPTYENDNLLHNLDDENAQDDEDVPVVVETSAVGTDS